MSRVLSLILLTGSIVTCFVVAELVLRIFAPATLVSIGRSDSTNARHYGWGFNPHDPLLLSDPDSGQVIQDRANNFGWRDKDRSLVAPQGTMRILVLGDSNTFGPLVSGDATYTRRLENMLEASGYAVEVLNIAYGGWAADQQLEALRREGNRFKPHLVVLQFCSNDLAEILAHGRGDFTGNKPFFYRLNDEGALVRELNPDFPAPASNVSRLLKSLIMRLEILKRVVLSYQHLKNAGAVQKSVSEWPFSVNKTQMRRILWVSGAGADSPLGRYLESHFNVQLDKSEVMQAIGQSALKAKPEDILRMAENRYFLKSGTNFSPDPPDPKEESWRLYLALLSAIRSEALSLGAPLLFLSDTEEGLYEWEIFWGRLESGESVRRNFLASRDLLRSFSLDHGIEFVEFFEPIQRARNDPHPNREGNETIARSLFHHLMTRHAARLDGFRR